MAAPVTVRGDRNVVNQGEINNSLVVMADNTTVNMQLDGAGAVLSWAFRWNRPRPRRRGDRPKAPPRMDSHVDREAEVAALAGGDGAPRIVNIYGEPGIGKTHVLVEALQRRECEGRDGTVYIRDARARSADDLLHAVFGALFETRVPIRDSEIERHLTKPRAVIALEDVDSGTDTGQRLVLAFGQSRLLVTSRDRVLYDGTPLKVAGLDPAHAVAIAEQELGRRLEGAERAAAEQIAVALRGHPFELRRAFGRARDEGRPLDALAPALTQPQDGRQRAAALGDGELELARTLAVHDGAALGSEHLAILGGPSAATAARALEARHDARSHSPRYSLEGPLAKVFSDKDLAHEVDRALEHFVPWAEREAERSNHDAVLREGRALVALLERATRLGRLEEVIALGFAIEGALAWGNRWAEWGRVLQLVLDAAQGRADTWAEASALHQLGTRAYGLGNAREARSLLERALEMRERIGDDAGVAATRQNLRVVSGSPPLLYRLSHASLALVAAVAALLVVGAGGAVGAGVVGEKDDHGGGGAAADHRLVVTVEGEGSVSDGGDISCGADCDATFADGNEVVLTARPGSRFLEWRGACEGAASPCRLRVAADQEVTAVFRKPAVGTVRLGVTAQPAAGGEVRGPRIRCGEDCSADVVKGRTVRLKAIRREGYTFVGWTGEGCEGQDETCDIRLEAASSVFARFRRVPDDPPVKDPMKDPMKDPPKDPGEDPPDAERYDLTVTLSDPDAGTVTSDTGEIDCPPTCRRGFEPGTQVTLTATELDGWTFEQWQGDCDATDGLTCDVTMTRAAGVTARYQRAVFELTTSATNGTVTASGSAGDCEGGCPYASGTVVTLRSTPSPLFVKAGMKPPPPIWGKGCVVTQDDRSECKATIDGPLTVTVEYPAPGNLLSLDG